MTPARRADIADRQDIADALAAFYSHAFADDLLSSEFVDVAHMNLAAHLPAMCDFWDTVLHRPGRYRCNALRVHTSLHDKTPLTAAPLSRWVALWIATVEKRHVDAKADLDWPQAIRIAWPFNRRLNGRRSDEPHYLTRRVAGWDPYLSAVTAEAAS
jgi:hemoglobin